MCNGNVLVIGDFNARLRNKTNNSKHIMYVWKILKRIKLRMISNRNNQNTIHGNPLVLEACKNA